MVSDAAGVPNPLILAFDTSAAQCAAAIVHEGQTLTKRVEPMGRGQAERLLPLLAECLQELGLNWADIDMLAVCTGPGNFTGIRLSIAAARGLAISTSTPAIGVSVFEAYAASRSGKILALGRNPRGKPHAQLFEDGIALSGHLSGIDTLEELPAETLCIGHGADEVRKELRLEQAEERIAPEPEWIGLSALKRNRASTERPSPLYLRAADAAPSQPAPAIVDEP